MELGDGGHRCTDLPVEAVVEAAYPGIARQRFGAMSARTAPHCRNRTVGVARCSWRMQKFQLNKRI